MRHFALLLGAYLLLILFPTASTSAGDKDDFEITKADFFVAGLAPVRKSGPYDITIVYFMDYQCPACRKYTPNIARVLNEDRRVRLIYRDTPLLGPRSDEAARAAIASSFQGRHEPFHYALMMTKGPLDETAIKAAAQKAGVHWSRLQRDMVTRREDIDLLVARNFELATEIGIAGTPAFIVGERQANGALDYKSLKLEIADARKELLNGGSSLAPSVRDTAEPNIAKKPPVAATLGQEAARKEPTGATVVFAQRIDELRSSKAADESRESKSWYWLVGASVGLLGLAAIWGWGRRLKQSVNACRQCPQWVESGR